MRGPQRRCYKAGHLGPYPHAGVHSRGPIHIWGSRRGGPGGHRPATLHDGQVRSIRDKPGGGGATLRRSVESGHTGCGVRVWSQGGPWREGPATAGCQGGERQRGDPPTKVQGSTPGQGWKNNKRGRMKRKRENERAIVTIDKNVQCRPEKYKNVVESKKTEVKTPILFCAKSSRETRQWFSLSLCHHVRKLEELNTSWQVAARTTRPNIETNIGAAIKKGLKTAFGMKYRSFFKT